MALEILINTGLGIGLLLNDTKPLLEPMLTYHERDPHSFQGNHNYYLNIQDINPHVMFEINTFEINHISQGTMS